MNQDELSRELEDLRYRVAELQESQARYEAMVEAFDGLIYICSSDYKVEFMNRRFIERTGRNPVGEDCYKALHEVESVCPWCVNERVLRGETVRWEAQSPKDQRWHYIVNTPIYRPDGSVSKMSMIQDVTEKKQSEIELREKESLYRQLIESAIDIIYRTDRDGFFTLVNPVTLRMSGYSEQELIGRHYLDLISPEYRSAAERFYGIQLVKKTPNTYHELPLVTKDGNTLWVGQNVQLLEEKGEILGFQAIARDIRARKRAEEDLRKSEQALRQSEEKYKVLVEESFDGVFVQKGANIAFTNSRLREMLGYDEGELEGQSHWLVYHPEYQEITRQRAEARLRGEPAPLRYEVRMQRKDRSSFEAEINARAIDFVGEPGIQVWIRDISESKQAENALRESEERFRTIFQTNPDPINIIRLTDGRIVDVNAGFTELTGFTREEVIGKSSLEINIWNDPDDRERLVAGLKESGQVRNFEALFRSKVGQVRAGLLSARIMEFNGESHILSVARDVDDWKRAQDALKNIVTGITGEIGVRFFDSSVTQFAKILGADFTLIGEISRRDQREVVKTIAFCSGGELQKNFEYDLKGAPCEEVTKNGICFYPRGVAQLFPQDKGLQRLKVEAYVGVCLYDSLSNPIGIMAAMYLRPLENGEFALSVLQIFASRAAAEIERMRSDDNLKRLFTAVENAGETILVTDSEGAIIYVNPAFEETTGYSGQEALGNNPRILKSGKHYSAFYREMWETLLAGQVWRGRFINKKKDGTLYEENATISPIKDESGRIVNYVAVKRDVTREALLQKQLLLAQKMEAIGTLAGGIAHDFNNLLQAVLGYSDLLLMSKEPGDPDRKKLEVIQHAARDGAELVERILTFSRKADSKVRPTDLNREIRKVEPLLRRTLLRMIGIRLLLAETLWIIEADPTQIEQMLLNLAVNAQHAMPDGGQLIIETSNASLSEEYFQTHLDARPGKYILLTVSDTGVGMEPEVMDRIFEPFFTTKADGVGTGLGLAMVHGIVSQHGGYIRCYSAPGGGTSFEIYLPVSARELLSDVTLTKEMPASGTETILLVDDDDRIREMGKQMIVMGGYQVLTARSGEEAVVMYAAHRQEIALVILDLIMPGMGGNRCLQKLMLIDPDVRVLVASGYSSNGLAIVETGTGARGFIRKPYDAKAILAAIRKVLDLGHL